MKTITSYLLAATVTLSSSVSFANYNPDFEFEKFSEENSMEGYDSYSCGVANLKGDLIAYFRGGNHNDFYLAHTSALKPTRTTDPFDFEKVRYGMWRSHGDTVTIQAIEPFKRSSIHSSKTIGRMSYSSEEYSLDNIETDVLITCYMD